MLERLGRLLVSGPPSVEGTESALQRVRWRFVLLNILAAGLAPLSLAQLDSPSTAGALVYVLSVAALAAWATVLYCTAGRWEALDLVGPGLVVAIGLGAGSPAWMGGSMYLALFLHFLYGRRSRVLRNAGLYLAAHLVLRTVTGDLRAGLSGLVANAVAVVVVAWVMSEMAKALRRNDRVHDREQALLTASGALLRATGSGQVAEVAAVGMQGLAEAGGPTPRAAVWWRDGESFLLAASVGPALGVGEVDLQVLPAAAVEEHLGGVPLRLGPEGLASAAMGAKVAGHLPYGLVVPLTDGEQPLGMVLIQTRRPVDADVIAAMQRFAHEVSLADRSVRRSELLAGIVDNSADGILLVDEHERFAFASPAMSDLVGRQVAVGEPLGALFAVSSGERHRAVTGLSEVRRHATLGLYRRHGDLLEVEVSLRPVEGAGTVLNVRDVSEQRRMQAEITYRAFYDPVTELPNRALFLDRLELALARAKRSGSHVALALVDLDDFKTINDLVGHLGGDQLLRHVAEQISSQVRESDTVARLGGDEFAVLLEGVAQETDLRKHLEGVLAAVRRPFDVDGHELTVTASAGIARSAGTETVEQLLVSADLAMYVGKERGKNHAVVFHSDLRVALDERRALRNELEQGIERDELRVHYQPIVSLVGGGVTGVEALVRWQHPTRGLIGPDRFVPLAEESGLIRPLGRTVLRAACRDLARWKATGVVDDRFQLHVNLSVRQLADELLVADVTATLAGSGVAPTHLVVEVTETALADNPEVAETTLRALHRSGVGVAIDDFGTGYASFSYLQHFPVDIVKIDQSFVAHVTEGPEQAALARAIVRMASSLGMGTVAEGVEHVDARDLLALWGCDHAQGWLWAPALGPCEVETWMVEHARALQPEALEPGPA